MEAGLLERMLRELPGVLDCSVNDEGVALVVHPEVDPRMIELHAKALLAETEDARPLLVVGGMTTGPLVALPPPARERRGRGGRSPLSATGVVVLVLALLLVVPLAGQDASSDRGAAPPLLLDDVRLPAPTRLPVVDEAPPAEELAASTPTPTPAPVAPEDGTAPMVVLSEPVLVAAVADGPASAAAATPTVFVAAAAPSPLVVQATKSRGKGRPRAELRSDKPPRGKATMFQAASVKGGKGKAGAPKR